LPPFRFVSLCFASAHLAHPSFYAYRYLTAELFLSWFATKVKY
jgi:hypothetical protein